MTICSICDLKWNWMISDHFLVFSYDRHKMSIRYSLEFFISATEYLDIFCILFFPEFFWSKKPCFLIFSHKSKLEFLKQKPCQITLQVSTKVYKTFYEPATISLRSCQYFPHEPGLRKTFLVDFEFGSICTIKNAIRRFLFQKRAQFVLDDVKVVIVLQV